jgi:hypothetical protein
MIVTLCQSTRMSNSTRVSGVMRRLLGASIGVNKCDDDAIKVRRATKAKDDQDRSISNMRNAIFLLVLSIKRHASG